MKCIIVIFYLPKLTPEETVLEGWMPLWRRRRGRPGRTFPGPTPSWRGRPWCPGTWRSSRGGDTKTWHRDTPDRFRGRRICPLWLAQSRTLFSQQRPFTEYFWHWPRTQHPPELWRPRQHRGPRSVISEISRDIYPPVVSRRATQRPWSDL